MAASNAKDEKTEVGTLPKGLAMLNVLANYPDGARFTDISEQTGYAVSTTHRIVNALVRQGFVEFNAARRLYSLGIRIFELSHKVATVNSLAETAKPVMKRLVETCNHTVLLNLLDGKETLVLFREDPSQSVLVRTKIGSRLPLHSTASGKAILASFSDDYYRSFMKGVRLSSITDKTVVDKSSFHAEINRTRECGFGVVNEENELGIRALAVVVPNTRQEARLALSIAAPAFAVTEEQLKTHCLALQDAASQIGNRLVGY